MRNLLRALYLSLRESWDGLRRNAAMSLLCATSTGVSLYVLGLFLLIAFNLNLLVTSLGQELQLQIYLSAVVSDEQIDSLRSALAADTALVVVF